MSSAARLEIRPRPSSDADPAPRRSAAAHLATIADAETPLDLWNEMLGLCRDTGHPEMCFIDMIGSADRPEIVATSYAPVLDLDAVRKALLREEGGVALGAGLLVFPAFGPQGLEAALVVTCEGGMGAQPCLGTAFQLAYSRYRQLLPRERSTPIALSDREREIMLWVVRGKSNAVIAEILGISASTVDTYMRRIFRKLEVADRTSAAMRAMAIGALS